ncbi:MAG: hypothetical protein VYD70_00305 [Planctomycetota bacterium]|nr:hypothetical protein [Planctomycetota bacterium]
MASARRRPSRSGSRHRGPRTSPDGDQENQDEGRPVYQPPAKKAASPVVVIITLVLFVGAGIFFAWAYVKSRDTTPQIVIEQTDTDKEYRQIQVKIQKSKKLVREVYQLRNDPDSARFTRKWSEANKYAGDTFDQLRAMVAEVRLPSGILPPEYSGYNSDFTQLQLIMGDLSKVAPLDFDWDSEE